MAAKQAQNEARASALGLLGRGPRMPTYWTGTPSAGQLQAVDAADAAVDKKVKAARMQSASKRAGTALGTMEDFLAVPEFDGVVPFLALRSAADLHHSIYNERMLCRLANFIREDRWIKGSSVSAYVSAIKVFVERDHKQPIVLAAPNGGAALRELMTTFRREDGPSGERRAGKPLRMQHVRQLAARPGYDRSSRAGKMRHAMRHAGLQGFLRPGEFGVVDDQPFEPRLHMHCGAEAIAYTTQPRRLFLKILAIKDQAAKRKRVPSLIQAAHERDAGDPHCPYEAIAVWHRHRLGEIAGLGQSPDEQPLFANEDGAAVQSTQLLHWNREDAQQLGLNPVEIFGNAWRAGAATDLLAAPLTLGGPEITVAQATTLIKARGRWWTDIYEIYSRWSADEHALASRAIAAATGQTMEDAVPGFVQPGRG